MREELGGKRANQPQDARAQPSDNGAPTRLFTSVCTSELSTPERQELLDKLNKSYKNFRIDYLVMCLSAIAFVVALFSQNPIAILISAAVGVIASVATSLFESKNRTVKIAYDFESDDISSYSKLVEAVNKLANCKRIWAYVNARHVTSLHESKVSGGASNLISRTAAAVGTGTPPWVETNVTIPTLTARGTTIYFMPDCLLIYDSKGVGCAKHGDLRLSAEVENFIEGEVAVPSDSTVVDHTWKFANKNGGPDRRFNNNVQIPICLYGVLNLSLPAGLLFQLQTSLSSAPREFSALYSAYITAVSA